MNYQWASTQSGKTAFNESRSTLSALTVRNLFQNAVPSGTVASRVRFLQSLESLPRAPPPLSTINRCREHSRSGFGRRLANRFASPSSRKTNPDEGVKIETAHTFLGLSTPRTNHDEVHATSDCRAVDQRNTLAGQIKSPGFAERIQRDALSPWVAAPKSRPATSTKCGESELEIGVLREVGPSSNQGHPPAEPNVFPLSSTEDTGSRGMYLRQPKSQRPATLNSETSFDTASTIRRQSVRELFLDYGIERPAGLASSKDPSREMDDTAQPSRPHTCCHVCSWVNNSPLDKCWRCGHRFCVDCDALSPPCRKEATLSSEDGLPKEQQRPIWPNLTPIRLPKNEQTSVRGLSSPPTKFPSFNLDVPVPQRKLIKCTPQLANTPERLRVLPALSGSRVTTSMKDSPFLVADIISGRQRLRLSPIGLCTSGHHTVSRQSRWGKRRQRSPSLSYSSSARECGSPVCAATCNGHQPNRHSSASSRRKQRVQETDIGYLADTSRVDEADIPQSNSLAHFSRTHSSVSRDSEPVSCPSQKSRLVSGLAYREADALNEYQLPEYVECRGYPRTGHSRHGNPVSTGIVGECQHCLACQSTSHSVRCCVHKGHRPIVHHHRIPRMVAKIATRSEFPESSLPNRVTPQISPPSSPPTAIPPRANRRLSSPPALAISPGLRTSQQSTLKKPALEKTPRLPRSKRSALISEASEPPTSPLWVSLPMINSIPAVAVPRARFKQTAVGPILSDTPIVDPPPLFKEMPTLGPPDTCEESSPEYSDVPSDGTWTTVPLGHDHEHNHPRQESYTLSSRNIATIKEQSTRSRNSGAAAQLQVTDPAPKGLHRMQERNAVSLWKQRLLNQEELRRIEKECDLRIGHMARGRARLKQPDNFKGQEKTEKMIEEGTVSSALSSKFEFENNWKLELVDKHTSQACPKDSFKAIQAHKLSDGENFDENRTGHEAVPAMWVELPGSRLEEHKCVWKSRVLDEKNRRRYPEEVGHMGFSGVTIVLHMEGREDLIVKADSWTGGELRRS